MKMLGNKNFKEDEYNHQHLCERKMLYNSCTKCPFGVKMKNMGWNEICDKCNYLRIVNLNKEGDHITSMNELKEVHYDL